MTQIDKIQFKFTIPVLISIISSTAFIVMAFNTYREEDNEKDNALQTELLLVKSDVKVVSNQVQNIQNNQERSNQERKAGLNELREDLRELKKSFDKLNFYSRQPITEN